MSIEFRLPERLAPSPRQSTRKNTWRKSSQLTQSENPLNFSCALLRANARFAWALVSRIAIFRNTLVGARR